MNHQNDLLMDTSILYRSTQKYYDKQLEMYNLTYAQLPILIMIYEHEGISSQQIAKEGSYDKGTITKNVQKLVSLGYVRVLHSLTDKRAKELYTTDRTKSIMSKIYGIRRDWWQHIIQGIQADQLVSFTHMYQDMVQRAMEFANQEQRPVQFFKQQKLSMKAYPDHTSLVLYTGGCNFRCPYCNQADLVFLKENLVEISHHDIFQYLDDNRSIIDAVCIDGGEPLMHEGLSTFLKQVKNKGFLVKVQTNGSFPDCLKQLVNENLVDFVGMDIKNSPKNYRTTIGLMDYPIDDVEESKKFLLKGSVPYAFYMTFVEEFHNKQDLLSCAKWLDGANHLIIQTLEQNGESIDPGLHPLTSINRESLKEIFRPYVNIVEIE